MKVRKIKVACLNLGSHLKTVKRYVHSQKDKVELGFSSCLSYKGAKDYRHTRLSGVLAGFVDQISKCFLNRIKLLVVY